MPAKRSARIWLACAFWLLAVSASSALAAPVKPSETVLFLSGLGWQQADGWNLEIHGWVYESKYYKPITSLFRHAIGIRDDELTATEQATFRERAQFFLEDNERNKSVTIQLGQMTFTLSNSAPNGHFQSTLHIALDDIDHFGLGSILTNQVAQFQMFSPDRRVHSADGRIQLLPATGLSVISDIDDTIKISSVRDHKELLRNTFCRGYRAVPGMAALYENWQKTANARFHYVSASPWQLYVPLSEFLQTNRFPEGTFHLKTFRIKDHTAFDLFKSPERFKLGVIEPLLKQFPDRRFILVGDSGERDPETYGALAREYSKQVARIFIRDTTGEPGDALRYQNAFSGLKTNLWKVFNDPAEIDSALPQGEAVR